MRALVNLGFELWIKFDTKFLGILFHVVKNLDTFQDRLVLIDMFDTLHIILDFDLFLEFKMRYFCLVKKFNIDISLIILNLGQYFVKIVVIIRFNSLAKFVLSLLDVIVGICAEADWSLFLYTIFMFVDPSTRCTKLTPELAGILTIVLDVTEIELRATTLLTAAVGCLNTFVNESPCFWVCGKIDWCMFSCVFQMYINTI